MQLERVRYSPYGTPYAYSFADYNMDGVIATGDQIDLNNAWSASEPAGDANGDGVYTVGDILDYLAEWTASNGNDGGEGVISTARGNRKGYAGYEFDGTGQAGESGIALYAHLRHRAYRTDLGRWLSWDPIGYGDGMNLYQYVRGMPILLMDHLGLYCHGRGCNRSSVLWSAGGPLDQEDDPTPAEQIVPIIIEPLSNNPIPTGVLECGPNTTRLTICAEYRKYVREQLMNDPNYISERDPHALMLSQKCLTAQGYATMRTVCCAITYVLPSGDVIAMPTIHRTECSSKLTDQQCCDMVPFEIVTTPPGMKPARRRTPGTPVICDDWCDKKTHTCVDKEWEIPPDNKFPRELYPLP